MLVANGIPKILGGRSHLARVLRQQLYMPALGKLQLGLASKFPLAICWLSLLWLLDLSNCLDIINDSQLLREVKAPLRQSILITSFYEKKIMWLITRKGLNRSHSARKKSSDLTIFIISCLTMKCPFH